MEILRFEQVPEGAPKRKKSSRGFLALGLVAALFGISTAFASSTITINADVPIQLGQGVTAVTACDNAIGVTPVTVLAADASGFLLNKILLGTGTAGASPDLTISTACANKIFKVTIYNDATTPVVLPCDSGKAAAPASTAAINGLKVLWVGINNDHLHHTCEGNSVYVQMPATLSTGHKVELVWGTDITSGWGFNLQDRPIGRIVVETTSFVPTW